jgi:hypothetical protein
VGGKSVTYQAAVNLNADVGDLDLGPLTGRFVPVIPNGVGPDITFRVPQFDAQQPGLRMPGPPTIGDVTIISAAAPSHIASSITSLFNAKQAEKEKKYRADVERSGASFVVLSATSAGHVSPAFAKEIRRITALSQVPAASALASVSAAIVAHTAEILVNAERQVGLDPRLPAQSTFGNGSVQSRREIFTKRESQLLQLHDRYASASRDIRNPAARLSTTHVSRTADPRTRANIGPTVSSSHARLPSPEPIHDDDDCVNDSDFVSPWRPPPPEGSDAAHLWANAISRDFSDPRAIALLSATCWASSRPRGMTLTSREIAAAASTTLSHDCPRTSLSLNSGSCIRNALHELGVLDDWSRLRDTPEVRRAAELGRTLLAGRLSAHTSAPCSRHVCSDLPITAPPHHTSHHAPRLAVRSAADVPLLQHARSSAAAPA